MTFSRFDAAFDDGDVWRLDLLTGLQTDLVSGPTFDLWSVWCTVLIAGLWCLQRAAW